MNVRRNPMDRLQFNTVENITVNNGDLSGAYQQAMQNPSQFEQRLKQMNPELYNQACQLRNHMSPRDAIMQVIRARGMNPSILNFLGFK